MNQKLQKVNREIGRAKAKIAELQASLPALEEQKTKLENDEIIKVFRSANVAPADFTAFIEKYKANMRGSSVVSASPAPQSNIMKEYDDEE